MRMTDARLVELVRPWLETAGLWDAAFADDRREWFRDVLALLRPRAKRLGDFVDGIGPFVTSVTYDHAAVGKHLTGDTLPILRTLHDRFATTEPFDPPTLEALVRGEADRAGLKAGVVIHAARVALTGRTVSPGLFEVMALLGRDTVRQRLEAAQALAPAIG
jgi:glutamyl-tRNA synthetase